MTTKRQKLFEYLNILILCATAVVLVGLQQKPTGWFVLAAGILLLLLCRRQFAKHLLLVYLSLGILGLTPINTDIDPAHVGLMGGTLLAALMLPYLISKYIYKDNIIRYKFRLGREWHRREITYIFLTATIAYLLLPFYLSDTGAYLNWTVEPSLAYIFVFFLGTNALGIWDELFFVNTVSKILRTYLPFWLANLVQAVLFTSFLYELGFTGWAPPLIYIFALTQAYIFKKTDSLLYIIAIHLTLDLVLFLALINAHYPDWLNIFITG